MSDKVKSKLDKLNDQTYPPDLNMDSDKYRPWSADTSIKVADGVVAFVHKDTGQVLFYKV